MALTREEIQLRRLMRVSAFVFSAETLVYLVPALVGESRGWGELPFVINSFLKAGLIGGVCFVAAADIRRFERLVSLVVIGLGLWVPGGIAVIVFGEHSYDVDLLGIEAPMTLILWGGVVFEGLLAIAYAIFHRRAFRAWHTIEYLSAGQFRTLSAIAEALLWTAPAADDTPPELTPDEVANNADRYLARFNAKRKWLMKAALIGINLYPLFFGKPTFTLLGADERRRFLEKRFGDDVSRRKIGETRRWLVQGMIRLAQQVVNLGFYGDRRTWPRVGYIPFSERPEGARAERRPRLGLEIERGAEVGSAISGDVVVVGSGAAGSILAYRLAEAGRSVILLERGPYVDPADFSEDEIEMLGTLYRDGAVQMARDFKLQILQGMCVGGTTVINNAVSIPPPAEVLEEWERRTRGLLDRDGLERGVESVRALLRISEQPPAVHQRGALKFERGIDELGLRERARTYAPIEANIERCLGCGYCNIGCAYGRKLSMLDRVLPDAKERFGDRVRIISEAEAEGIETSHGRATAIHCRANGTRIRVAGERFVISAGPINSSYLLGRSGVGGPRVGHGVSFNIGSPITAEFDEEIRAYEGLQITHAFEPPTDGPDVLMETWFNPVVSQAMAMPGWFEDHRRNMLAYARMAATGVLVGTESNGRVAKALFGGADVIYEPTDADLRRLVEGLKLCARIYLAAGAKRVMPATFAFHAFTRPEQVDALDELVRTNEDIQLGTGHPQGGNALAADRSEGPVHPGSFRVHGLDNLHVCDASVFPTSVRVNPQLTTMALAELAAAQIVAAGR